MCGVSMILLTTSSCIRVVPASGPASSARGSLIATAPATGTGSDIRQSAFPQPSGPAAGTLVGETSDLAHLIGRVQRGDLIRLRERRVVEDGVDQVVDSTSAAHHGLADVHQLGRPGPEHMHAEQSTVFRRDQQFQHAVGVTDDLPATNWNSAGIYCFRPGVFEEIDRVPLSPRGEYVIT